MAIGRTRTPVQRQGCAGFSPLRSAINVSAFGTQGPTRSEPGAARPYRLTTISSRPGGGAQIKKSQSLSPVRELKPFPDPENDHAEC